VRLCSQEGRSGAVSRKRQDAASTSAQNKRPSRKLSLEDSDLYLAGNETAVWVELQLGHPHDPSNPAKNFSLRARLGNFGRVIISPPDSDMSLEQAPCQWTARRLKMAIQLWHIYFEIGWSPITFLREFEDYLLEMQCGGLKIFSILQESGVGFGAETTGSAPKIN
jgi:hypothetical protein